MKKETGSILTEYALSLSLFIGALFVAVAICHEAIEDLVDSSITVSSSVVPCGGMDAGLDANPASDECK